LQDSNLAIIIAIELIIIAGFQFRIAKSIELVIMADYENISREQKKQKKLDFKYSLNLQWAIADFGTNN